MKPRRVRRIAYHFARVSLFLLTIALIHLQHARIVAQRSGQSFAPVTVARLRPFFPAVDSIADEALGNGGRLVFDASGKALGYILQTSPGSDHLIGFSGPTNTLIALSLDDRIVGVDILSSGDTRDHVAQVIEDRAFLSSFRGLNSNAVSDLAKVDGVSGATLTSLTIQESIIHRLSGDRPSLRFPEPLTVDQARPLFELAHQLERDPIHGWLWNVADERNEEIGSILRTSPTADNIIGYQGPTEALIGFDPDGRIVGISIAQSYDNEPYVTYVREDKYFLALFNELVLDDLAKLDLVEAEIEGVSGATMTSMAVAKGLVVAAEHHRQAVARMAEPRPTRLRWSLRDLGTAVVILVGLAVALTSLRGKKTIRVGFQCLVIGYLGLINGDILSQAMIVGWAQNGVPWSNAGGLLLLTLAAFLVPLTTRRNPYCTHLCPHGAAQQLLKNRLPWRLRVPHRLLRTLKIVPAALLAWCVLVAMVPLPFSLVDIEPFDAWVVRVAGWATITIAVVGLVASLFVPMAYCRCGCPTGALLNFLRGSARSDRWSRRDWFAVGLVATALGIWMAS